MAAPTDFLVSKIVSVLENEAALVGGIGDELEDIKHELVSMISFLKDADARRPHTEGEKTWVANVRDLVYDVEDVIDQFMYVVNRRQGRHEPTKYLLKAVASPKDLWKKHQIATRLQKIKIMLKAVRERGQRYGVDRLEGSSSSENDRGAVLYGETSLFLKDDELVGIEDGRELLVGWLTDGEALRTTISVVGMGGSGKTTLAAKAYNSQNVKWQFDCYAWITVSQTYVIEELFRNLIKQFYQVMKEAIPADLNSMNYKNLVELLVNFLEPKRYLLVLDDVWDADLWNQIKVALPNSQPGCRVLLTTRKEDIAVLSFEVGSHVHHVKPLEDNEAWALFCLKAFSRNGNRCPPELEIFAKDIVEKCQGLPLAIVSLGGLFSTKSSELEWRTAYNSLNWELSNNRMLQSVKSILLLSYNDLPYHLKHCFLYCCLFPEDSWIKRKKLIRLWMAEGFIKKVRGLTPEEVADKSLMELIRRSMLQVVERNSYGLPKACKMHDLLRELALSISEEEKFCAVLDERRAGEQEGGVIRRLSVQANERDIALPESMPHLRSFLLFVTDILYPYSLKTLFCGFKLLRVLDLEDAPIENLPDCVGTFFNLRYLNLKRTHVKELPKSIGRLQNLETLNIDETKVKVLPSEIGKLKNLRYLLTRRLNLGLYNDFNYITGTRMPASISTLKNLQVLGCIEVNGCVEATGMIGYLKSMTQLARLEISRVKGSDELALCSSIEKMRLLRRLFVMACDQDILKMDALEVPPPHLARLSLVGKLEKIPPWFRALQSLRVLYLHWSRLSTDPLRDLQALPNLRWLILVRAYEGSQLNFLQGFNKLELLELRNCPALESIIIASGVMPGIKEMWIGNCIKLMLLHWGLRYLTNLQELTLINVPKQVFECSRPSVQHIPKINNVNFTSSGWSQESLS